MLPFSSWAKTCNSKISPIFIESKLFSIEIDFTSENPTLHLNISLEYLSLALTYVISLTLLDFV